MTNNFERLENQNGIITNVEFLIINDAGSIIAVLKDFDCAVEFVEKYVRSDSSVSVVRQVTTQYIVGLKLGL